MQAMLLPPLLEQALRKEPLLVLTWVVFVDFHKSLASPEMHESQVPCSLSTAGEWHFLQRTLGLEASRRRGSGPTAVLPF